MTFCHFGRAFASLAGRALSYPYCFLVHSSNRSLKRAKKSLHRKRNGDTMLTVTFVQGKSRHQTVDKQVLQDSD